MALGPSKKSLRKRTAGPTTSKERVTTTTAPAKSVSSWHVPQIYISCPTREGVDFLAAVVEKHQ